MDHFHPLAILCFKLLLKQNVEVALFPPSK